MSYIRMAQGPQIYSTPKFYEDLTDIPLQNGHKEVFSKKVRLSNGFMKSLPSYHDSFYKK
jgi:hypothetical protein